MSRNSSKSVNVKEATGYKISIDGLECKSESRVCGRFNVDLPDAQEAISGLVVPKLGAVTVENSNIKFAISCETLLSSYQNSFRYGSTDIEDVYLKLKEITFTISGVTLGGKYIENEVRITANFYKCECNVELEDMNLVSVWDTFFYCTAVNSGTRTWVGHPDDHTSGEVQYNSEFVVTFPVIFGCVGDENCSVNVNDFNIRLNEVHVYGHINVTPHMS